MLKLSQPVLSCSLLVRQSSRGYRFVPSKPVWRWHDDRTPCEDKSVFSIPVEEIPPKVELDDHTLKLLERLSLVQFNEEKTKSIVEEAIHFADCLLTPTAFGGVERASVKPMVSLLDEPEWEPINVMRVEEGNGDWLEEDERDSAKTAEHILANAAQTWENYFVAPLGNRPLHPELGKTPSTLEKKKKKK